MKMYNMIFGQNPLADYILATLGLMKQDTGRFRDAFVAQGEIAIYTRNGGGNRESYQEVIDKLRAHPCYLRDADDDFDSTYATFYFKFPAEYAEELKRIDSGEKFEPSARWLESLAMIRKAAEGK